jgi:hypothetical protein
MPPGKMTPVGRTLRSLALTNEAMMLLRCSQDVFIPS